MSSATSNELDSRLAASPAVPMVIAALDALEPLAVSADPATVWASALELCVPTLCDSASLELVMPDQPAFRSRWPRPDPQAGAGSGAPSQAPELDPAGPHRLTATTVYTPVRPAAGDHASAYRGMLAMEFPDRRPGPTEVLLGQLVAERVASTIHRERLRQEIATETERATHLQQALLRNREIGAALGILMATQKCTNEAAFAQLRSISQNTHRKLHEIALDVIDTGMLETAPDPDKTDGRR